MLERSSNSPQARSKAQQAAEERFPGKPGAPANGGTLTRREAYSEGYRAALPENPDPAVIEAMAKVLNHEQGFDDWVEANETQRSWCLDLARSAYAALRGAMPTACGPDHGWHTIRHREERIMSATDLAIREVAVRTVGTCRGCGEGGCYGGAHCPCEGCACPSDTERSMP